MFTSYARAVVPPRCIGCGDQGRALCRSCRAAAAAPVEDARFAHVARVVCPWDYAGLPRRLVLDLKLRGLAAAAEPLIEGIVELGLRRGVRGEVVTWVPCRRGDRRRRGFDHGEALARGVARLLGLPCVGLLARSGVTVDQAGLSASRRAENLRGAFVSRPVSTQVVLVDDLVTTGATASECARAMRGAGAGGVEVLAACRA